MPISSLAGKPAPKDMLVDLAQLEREYFERRPDLSDPNQLVSFGTSGHRGTPLHGTFTEAHILAITQAICDYRRVQGTFGPLYLGKDTHVAGEGLNALSLRKMGERFCRLLAELYKGLAARPGVVRSSVRFTGNLSETVGFVCCKVIEGLSNTPSKLVAEKIAFAPDLDLVTSQEPAVAVVNLSDVGTGK